MKKIKLLSILSAAMICFSAMVSAAELNIESYSILKGHTAPVSTVCMLPGSRLLSAGLDGTAVLWDIRTSKEIIVMQHGSPIEKASASRDGKFAATCGRDGACKLWELSSGRLLAGFDGFSDKLFLCGFTNDSKLLFAGGNGKIRVFSTSTFKEVQSVRFGLFETMRSIDFSADGKYILCGHGSTISVYSLGMPNFLQKVFNPESISVKKRSDINTGTAVYCSTFTPDGQHIVSGGEGRMLSLRRSVDGYLIWAREAHRDIIWDAAVSSDGTYIASAGADGKIMFHDTDTGNAAGSKDNPDQVYSLSFSPDGGMLAAAIGDGTIRLWRVPAKRDYSALIRIARILTASVVGVLILLVLIASFKLRA